MSKKPTGLKERHRSGTRGGCPFLHPVPQRQSKQKQKEKEKVPEKNKHSSAVCRIKVRDSKQGKDYNRSITCDYCHKRGHSVNVCWNKIKDEQLEECEENNETDL